MHEHAEEMTVLMQAVAEGARRRALLTANTCIPPHYVWNRPRCSRCHVDLLTNPERTAEELKSDQQRRCIFSSFMLAHLAQNLRFG